MPLPVQLKHVVDALDALSNEWQAYINRRTGELVSFSSEEAGLAEQEEPNAPDWITEHLPRIREVLESEEFVALPSKFDFNEYQVMKRFCLQQEDAGLRESLLKAIHGSGGFQRFKMLIHRRNIGNRWYEYRDSALNELAAQFLEAEGIPFVAK